MNNKNFWEFRNAADSGENAELILYGSISSETWYGDEVTPKAFSDELKALGDIPGLTVRINSGGGDVFAAFAIYNRLCDLRRKGCKVKAVVDGWAASAATIICMAADSISIPATAAFMIHDPAVGMYGSYKASELEKLSGELDTVKSAIISAYCRKTKKSVEDVSRLMSEETWYTGEEAVENGFCDVLITDDTPKVEDRGGHVFVNSVEMDRVPKEVLLRLSGSNTKTEKPAVIEDKAEGEPGATNKTTEKTEGNEMAEIRNVGDLRAAYPDFVKEIENDARAAERSRIKAIEDATVSGFEDMAQDAKFKDCTTAEDMAVKVLNKIRTQGASYLSDREKDAQNSGVSDVGSAPAPKNDEEDAEFDKALKTVFTDKK